MEDGDQTDDPQWARVKGLFARLLELPPSERAAILDVECAGDADVRAEVEGLLAETGTDFLETPAARLLPRKVSAGDVIGGFTLRRLIGEGGMGRVYEAEQERPQRAVAIKLLRPGFVGLGAEKRFEWEVEALGRLSHPAIARVLDAGVEVADDGEQTSWFAMELVEGDPLLLAADSLGLDRRERLELFTKVCDGVAHAHARGIIHRDLKPGNVLVSANASPHILDFGISRSTDAASTSVTNKGELVGTLAYMAPEQVAGDPEIVDARADVYALGIILYRLLTGRAPIVLDGIPLPEAIRRIADADATPAGRVDKSLRGDLETILATALERDQGHRYQSVDRLVDDVRRYLTDQPISARPATAFYQLGKLAQRHRGLTAGLALSLALLLVAIAGTSTGFLRASKQRDRAAQESERARDAEHVAASERDRATAERDTARIERDRATAVNDFLDRMLASADPRREGRDVRVADLLERASEELEEEESLDDAVRAALHFTLGRTFEGLGLLDAALEQMELSYTLHQSTARPSGSLTLRSMIACCALRFETGDFDGAVALQVPIGAHMASATDLTRDDEIDVMELEAMRLDAIDDRAGHLAAWRDILSAREADPHATLQGIATTRHLVATTLVDSGRPQEAEPLLRESYETLKGVLGENHPEVLAMASNWAQCLVDLGRPAEAVALIEPLMERGKSVWGERHENFLSLRGSYAKTLTQVGRWKEALVIYEEDLPKVEARFPATHETVVWARNNLAMALMYDQRPKEGEELLKKTLLEMEGGPAAAGGSMRLTLQNNLVTMMTEGPGNVGREAEVLELAAEIVEGFSGQVGEGAVQTINARNNLMTYLTIVGRSDEAADLAVENLRISRKHHPGHPMNVFPLGVSAARPLADAERFDEAVEELKSCLAELEKDPKGNAFAIQYCRKQFAYTYEAWNKPEEAAKWRVD